MKLRNGEEYEEIWGGDINGVKCVQQGESAPKKPDQL